MSKLRLSLFTFLLAAPTFAQTLDTLTVATIMRDPKWIGPQPENIVWDDNSRTFYFSWNPGGAFASDSLYKYDLGAEAPIKLSPAERRQLPPSRGGQYDAKRLRKVYAQEGDLYLRNLASGAVRRLTNTWDQESDPKFTADGKKVVFRREKDLYLLSLGDGTLEQVIHFTAGKKPGKAAQPAEKTRDAWLAEQQLALMEVLRERKAQEDLADSLKKQNDVKRKGEVYTHDRTVSDAQLSADGRYVTYTLYKPANDPTTLVPDYVTRSGYTTDIQARSKVGGPQPTQELFVYDRDRDSAYAVRTDDLPGIRTVPEFRNAYATPTPAPSRPAKRRKKAAAADTTQAAPKAVALYGPVYPEGDFSVERPAIVVRSRDNKDRWIGLLNLTDGTIQVLDHQHDEAWIGGPGIGSYGGPGNLGWLDATHLWFQSEKTGYAHLYVADVRTGEIKALTQGKYEVQEAQLSRDRSAFYLLTNAQHPGEKQLYRLDVAPDGTPRGEAQRLTQLEGANEPTLSPDEKWIVVRHSFSNEPWDLFLIPNIPDTTEAPAPIRITDSRSEAFKSYPWRAPEVITFAARDGAEVHARLYRPEDTTQTGGPAVVFVHGAGYLQNAHRWWSSYFREYMFHNLLADRGYTVLDIDYRGSAGYGRDWRTGIYRYMGDKDLTDQVDGARMLTERYGIDAKRIGIYGGSYGGFITLMAMFTQPNVFAAGAALRSVTDWAHYNHGYTSNILNEPTTDSLAYVRSSPIYFAEGLQGALLMCHGMVDTNVHFQDIVRLTQRLIELGKDNWELAVYPVESHGFVEPSSWTDEYKRILKLFEENLR
ncbi:Dipeptidyl aminopeptidase/acylaminoacyl peptidase [Catalinimonas alkaloidigena]|uniref:Dipeptidyl aminopeptidase/acylaminoacyl peptidase n=1 Tax=Catalinimonas alkaloidigena TaxID=1075417 RepID=A0A1G8YBB8_9BACT|nr:prolyl oligopeptidase family serine peptidase [Catalinimonas alkaloidigena]SDJ99545.1 Dipeptidyl aminopeptidase/acylaminoacyl peptidase [Catalinimonas alkaloidigena]